MRLQNLLVEERVSTEGLTLYANYLDGGPISDLDDWGSRHADFAVEEIEIGFADALEPWTFRAGNAANRLPLVDRRINLIRVEDAGWPCRLNSTSFEEVSHHIEALSAAGRGKAEIADHFLTRFLTTWNAERDKRPSFVTTELEVEDILQDAAPGWAEKLRDRLGLGHYSPMAGAAPIPVFIMRYPLEEVYSTHDEQGQPSIPTLLDGRLNDFFFPSPLPGPNPDPNPCLGHTLNLTPVDDENDYKLGVELLHRRIDYRPEHFYRTGIIANPLGMPLERARRFHLPWLRLSRDREDFGKGVMS
ncbi:hypothetical protein F6R98_00090 [Candidatus Methylospira mobilis]|uniref:Uncharacterized protein n=1 Tax=Candidatus Methylospira mobilis TaxID=1808979 RepID=A0A5Q0BH96_9GAMM|nr:hypothetical protein [Candidatus Methylospira mobilis]QFY41206.1 hypothetical protein F6R98_00090 [Candidatus Methylospira mobilis]WNV05569.1 hypothetical protein RP726_03910 [Candidatus Methylospira mobilis]